MARRRKKKKLSLAEMDADRIRKGVFLNKFELVDEAMRPLRQIRSLEQGPHPGVPQRKDVLRWEDPAWLEPAPDWAYSIALRLARLFFRDRSHILLLELIRGLVRDEERGRAAQSVLMAFLPDNGLDGWEDTPLSPDRSTWRIWEALEKVAWTV